VTSLISLPCAVARRMSAYQFVSTVLARTSKVIRRPWPSVDVMIAALAAPVVKVKTAAATASSFMTGLIEAELPKKGRPRM
jgi:hypothetical protein